MHPGDTLAAARGALGIVVERFARLVETQTQTQMSALLPGSLWTVRDVAVHLAGGNHRHIGYVRGQAPTAAALDKKHLDARARRQIAENPETDPKRLSAQIRDGFAEAMAATATVRGDQPIIYHAGLQPSFAGLSCFLLGEYLLHGYDAASALARPWPIDPEHAALALDAYRLALPLIFQPQAAARLQATYEIGISGAAPFFVSVSHCTYEEVDDPPAVDCEVSTDAVTALLILAGRLSQWPAIVLGCLRFTGPHPEVGPRFADLFVFP